MCVGELSTDSRVDLILRLLVYRKCVGELNIEGHVGFISSHLHPQLVRLLLN